MPDTWVPVCPLSALQPGQMKLIDTGTAEIIMVNVDGELFALEAICTHALGYLDEGELRGHEIICPLHEGSFDVRTGAVLNGPPEQPLPTYQVAVHDNTIQVKVANQCSST